MKTFSNFEFYNPTRIVFGKDTIQQLADLIGKDENILMVYGGGSIKTNGVYQQVTEALKNHKVTEFSGVEANPAYETLNKAVDIVRNEKITFILAVGGGSVIDGCKYIAAAALYDGEGWDILEWKHNVTEALPLGVVLTLPATGSESNAGAVITRRTTHEKRFFHSEAVFPKFSVMDYTIMSSLSDRQLANGVADSFIHVCEQYLTYQVNAPVQDGYAETLLSTIANLANTWDARRTESWQMNLMWAANQALNGLIRVGMPEDWATHMIGHELTALYGIDHGQTLAIIQPALLMVEQNAKTEKLHRMGRNVFGLTGADNTAERVIKEIEKLYHAMGIKTHLKEYVKDPDIPAVIAALKSHGMVKLGERGAVTPEVSEKILKIAL